jgi:hypothetical protein
MRKPDRPKPGQIFRCAIYTRKSSDDGLEQEFNSLDAQREACEAYITSQRHAGWIALPDMYDDGGLSGGTMERPALKRLLAEGPPWRLTGALSGRLCPVGATLAGSSKSQAVGRGGSIKIHPWAG